LGGPPGGVGRVDHNDREAGVVAHLYQAVAEPGCGDAGYSAPEVATTVAACGSVADPFPAFGPVLGEVEVFNDHGMRAVLSGRVDEVADRGAYPGVTGAGR
jgi:hypothetical protein